MPAQSNAEPLQKLVLLFEIDRQSRDRPSCLWFDELARYMAYELANQDSYHSHRTTSHPYREYVARIIPARVIAPF